MTLALLRTAKMRMRRAKPVRFVSLRFAAKKSRPIERAADANRSKIRKVVLHAAKSARASLDVRGLENAFRERSITRAMNATDFAVDTLEHRLRRDLPRALRAAVVSGGRAEAKKVRVRGFRTANDCHDPDTGQFCGDGGSVSLSQDTQLSSKNLAHDVKSVGNGSKLVIDSKWNAQGKEKANPFSNHEEIQVTTIVDVNGTTASINRIDTIGDQGRGSGREALSAVVSYLDRAGITQITAYIERGNVASETTFSRVGFSLSQELSQGNLWVREKKSKNLRAAKKGASVSFNTTNDRATKWAERRSATRVTEIGRDARASIREIVSSMFERGVPPRAAARQIREVVGLTSEQSAAVSRLRDRLELADGNTITAFAGRLKFRVPEGGSSEEQIAAWTERYADKLLDHRAMMIARTESIDSANEGQRELWGQAIEQGFLGADSKRKWLAGGPRMCVICEEMDGQVVGIDEPFVTPDGEEIDGPTAHPGCTCSQGITNDRAS